MSTFLRTFGPLISIMCLYCFALLAGGGGGSFASSAYLAGVVHVHTVFLISFSFSSHFIMG